MIKFLIKTIFIFNIFIFNKAYSNELIDYSKQKYLLNQKIESYQFYLNSNNIKQQIPENLKITINESNNYVYQIKQTLFLSGEYKNNELSNNIFNLELSTAIFNFQINNSLNATGELNSETIKKLNIPPQIILNKLISNYKQIKDINYENNYIIVNIPFYSLDIMQNNQLVYSMGVIVGSNRHQSCILNSEIRQIVINPSWYVPKSITKSEYIHKLSNNPEYFENRNFKIIENGEEFSPIDYTGDYENIKLIQQPSKNNALGQIKFIFDNSCGIYLHDTNQRNLFSDDKNQNLSHGCIRLSKPFILADFLFRYNNLNVESINYYLSKNETKTINLNNKYKIYIIYQNYAVNNNNEIVIKKDIYKKFDK